MFKKIMLIFILIFVSGSIYADQIKISNEWKFMSSNSTYSGQKYKVLDEVKHSTPGFNFKIEHVG